MAPFSANLSGRHALVTGGTKGIGRAIVEALLSEGANVSYCARTVRDQDFADFQRDRSITASVSGTAVDLAETEAIGSWVDAAADKFGGIDIVVANAPSYAQEATPQGWQKSFQIDILGLTTLIEASLPHLKQTARPGSIIVISSLAGFEARHHTLTGPYSAFKRSQAILVKGYARALGAHGIRVNAVIPGAIETPNRTLPDGTIELSAFAKARKNNAAYIESTISAIPLGRPGEVHEVANAVVFLSSPLSSYISGANLVVDGCISTTF